MKKIIAVFLLYMLYSHAHAQQPYYYSQFFKVAPAFNPAFTGVDELLDIKLTHRTQWGGFDGAPTTNYVGIYRGFREDQEIFIKEYSLRISNPNAYDSIFATSTRKLRGKTKHGIGGFINFDSFGPFDQIKGNLNYSFHLTLKDQSFIAFGLSVGLTNNRLDLAKINLADPDIDEFYQRLVSEGGNTTSLTVNPGVLYYSPKFYIGYSASNLGEFPLQETNLSDDFSSMTHYLMSGYQFPVADKMNLQASVFYYYYNQINNNLDVNVKLDFNRKGYAGVSYRKTGDIIAMAGFTIQNKFQLGYSYDMRISGRNDLNNSAHELSLGLLLYNRDLNTSYTW